MDTISKMISKMFPDPRVLWNSADGTAIRDGKGGYKAKPPVKVVKRKLTEAEDNAIGRAIRRKQNKRNRGWLPFAQR